MCTALLFPPVAAQGPSTCVVGLTHPLLHMSSYRLVFLRVIGHAVWMHSRERPMSGHRRGASYLSAATTVNSR